MRLQKVLWIAAVVAVELGILYADVIVFIGFTSINNIEALFTRNLSLLLMCICDLLAFVCSWIRLKAAAIILAASSGVTLILCLIAADKHSIEALWLLGGAFWAIKFLLAYVFYTRLGKSPTFR